MNNKKEFSDNIKNSFREKARIYKNPGSIWDKYSSRIKELFSDNSLFNFCFSPFKKLFNTDQRIITEKEVYKVITQVAVANAVMAGLPGKMGVGVYISFALEFYMALRIAQLLKVGTSKEDILKLFGIIGGSTLMIFLGFRQLLGFFFSLFSFVPYLNPMIIPEIFVTNLVGLIFLVGFQEIKKGKTFKVPLRAIFSTFKHAYGITKHQLKIIIKIIDYKNTIIVGKRLRAWLTGDIINPKKMKGEYLVPLSMAYLIAGDYEKLEGPLGKMFIASIRDQFGSLSNASLDEISAHMSNYSSEQMQGVIKSVKGKLFERMYVEYENSDGDEWKAELVEDPYNPGYDVILTNEITGDEIFLSLKATDTSSYVESALDKYAYPVLVTKEVGEEYTDNDMVMVSHFTNKHITKVTEENFDDLLTKDIDRLAVGGVAAGGVTLATVIALWPYVIANYRGLITNDQLKSACMGICGDSGKELFKRVTLAIACGPIYAWWLLARMSMKLTDISTEEEKTTESFQDEEPKDTGPKKYTRRQLFMKFVPTMSTT